MAHSAQLVDIKEIFSRKPTNRALSAYSAAAEEDSHREITLYNNLFWLVAVGKIKLFDVDLYQPREIFVQRCDDTWTQGLSVSEAEDLVQQLLGKHI